MGSLLSCNFVCKLIIHLSIPYGIFYSKTCKVVLKGRNNIKYMASSNQGLMSTNVIVILDENWNVVR